MKKHAFFGEVKDGQFEPFHKKDFMDHVKYHEGKRVQVTVEPLREKKSDRQRRYYWGYLLQELEDYTGYEKDVWHEFFKAKFLKIEIETPYGTEMAVRSTEDINTKEAEAYHEKIRRWAIDTPGIALKLPNEDQWWASLLQSQPCSKDYSFN